MIIVKLSNEESCLLHKEKHQRLIFCGWIWASVFRNGSRLSEFGARLCRYRLQRVNRPTPVYAGAVAVCK